MNAGELADYLATQPRDREIIMQKDEEGNGNSPLDQADESMYVPTTTWSGDIHPTPEQLADPTWQLIGWTDEDAAPEHAQRVILLTPVN